MREILFRGKRTDNGEWVEGYYRRTHDCSMIICGEGDDIYGVAVIPETVGRLVNDPCYTDYTDQRYFQGDIIELYSAKNKHVEHHLGIVIDEHCYWENGLGRCFTQDILQAKVVGNVWDNSDLIDEEYIELYKYYHCGLKGCTDGKE